MDVRSTRSKVTFRHPFTLSGYPDELPAGDYEVLVEEELLQGLSFAAYRRTAAYLMVQAGGGTAGRTELRPIADPDLVMLLSSEGDLEPGKKDAALSRKEGKK